MAIKNILTLMVILILMSMTIYAKNFEKSASHKPILVQKCEGKQWCIDSI